MRFVQISVLVCAALISVPASATEPDVQALVEQAVRAAGGKDKLLKLFRIEEQLSVGSDPDKKGKVRISVIEPPAYWWIGKKQRDEDEPARYLPWAWTIGAVTDPKSKLEVLPEMMEADVPAFSVGGNMTECNTQRSASAAKRRATGPGISVRSLHCNNSKSCRTDSRGSGEYIRLRLPFRSWLASNSALRIRATVKPGK